MAIATHTVFRIDALSDSILTGPVEMRLVRMLKVPGFAFYDASTNFLAVGADAARRKFIIAHEMGHWLQSRAQLAEGADDGIWSIAYGYPAPAHVNSSGEPLGLTQPDAACRFAVHYEAPLLEDDVEQSFNAGLELHGIRTSEYAPAAMTEGFAQFVAAVAFNPVDSESGEFVYYKEIDLEEVPEYEDFVGADGLVALPGGSAEETLGGWNRWVENSCENDWDVLFFNAAETTPTAISSEIDWMRFFWEFLTSQDEGLAPQPGFADVIRILAHTDKNNSWGSIESVWELMVLTMDEDEEFAGLDLYLERFEALNATHGVWHDPSL